MKRLTFMAALLVAIVIAVASLAGPVKTSGTTAQQIVSDARVYLTEKGTGWASNEEMLSWLNDGVKDIVAKSHCTETVAQVSLTADTIGYTLTATPVKIQAVLYTNEDGEISGLQRTTLEGIQRKFTGSVPQYFYFYAGKLGIYPSLSSVTNSIVSAYMVYLPAAAATGSTVEIPSMYDRALKLYIVAQGFIKDGRFADAQLVMGMYQAEIDRFREDMGTAATPHAR